MIIVGSLFFQEVYMDKRTIEKLKRELLTKKSHDIFKNVQAIFDLAYSTNDMDLNFKCREISSRFSGGNITKDNLCRLYGIDNIQEIHTGANDCLLEWELFQKLDGNKLLITHDRVYEFNNDYIVPASYLVNYPNFKYHAQNLPRFKCSSKIIKRFEVVNSQIKKFPTNFNGMIIEHLINTMLDVEKIDSTPFLMQNKSKLKHIGKLPSPYDEIYMNFNNDGTVTAAEKKDKNLADELNKFILLLKKEINPLIDYIRKTIFKERHILSQELVVHRDKNVLALCDLSNDTAVLEIKTYVVWIVITHYICNIYQHHYKQIV